MPTYQIFFIVAWILLQIATIGLNVRACCVTADSMSTTGLLLHKLKPRSDEEPVSLIYQIIQIFSIEVMQRKNNFTAAGFFDMNYKLITSIIGAVTTYLVIIIQFYFSNINNKMPLPSSVPEKTI
ncbi:putative gustatory receptor 28b [Teleopsis dalmanni]|uniref:putative gustatory receptor 28b n=1 Tax=Teleopsis dalmanni TaxID=139649 RepID=UPI0018CDD5F7|nr:putative gustatory receptor 28b [Teleopsis dalmanni]